MAVGAASQERLAANKRERAGAAAVSHPPTPTTEPSRVALATYEFSVDEANKGRVLTVAAKTTPRPPDRNVRHLITTVGPRRGGGPSRPCAYMRAAG